MSATHRAKSHCTKIIHHFTPLHQGSPFFFQPLRKQALFVIGPRNAPKHTHAIIMHTCLCPGQLQHIQPPGMWSAHVPQPSHVCSIQSPSVHVQDDMTATMHVWSIQSPSMHVQDDMTATMHVVQHNHPQPQRGMCAAESHSLAHLDSGNGYGIVPSQIHDLFLGVSLYSLVVNETALHV